MEDSTGMPSDETTIVPPLGDKHTHTVIFLHGREDFGSDLAEYFFDSKSSDGWVFPTAKLRYSARRDYQFSNSSFAEALKGEEIISQWFDLWDIEAPEEKEELMVPGLQESIAQITDLVKAEAQKVPLDRIILGGVSQGCATSILALLSSGMRLGGFIGLCGWLPFEKKIGTATTRVSSDVSSISRHIQKILEMDPKSNETGINHVETSLACMSIQSASKTPIFLAHSRDDETVAFSMGATLKERIQDLGFEVVWKEYQDGGHWIHPGKGVDDMAAFLHDTLGI